MGQNSFTENSDIYIKITGGKVTVDASGDGLDSNSNLIIEGGEIYVNGPTNDGNGALDYDGTATISGGTFVAVGSSGMVQGSQITQLNAQFCIIFQVAILLMKRLHLLIRAEMKFFPIQQQSNLVRLL